MWTTDWIREEKKRIEMNHVCVVDWTIIFVKGNSFTQRNVSNMNKSKQLHSVQSVTEKAGLTVKGDQSVNRKVRTIIVSHQIVVIYSQWLAFHRCSGMALTVLFKMKFNKPSSNAFILLLIIILNVTKSQILSAFITVVTI